MNVFSHFYLRSNTTDSFPLFPLMQRNYLLERARCAFKAAGLKGGGRKMHEFWQRHPAFRRIEISCGVFQSITSPDSGEYFKKSDHSDEPPVMIFPRTLQAEVASKHPDTVELHLRIKERMVAYHGSQIMKKEDRIHVKRTVTDLASEAFTTIYTSASFSATPRPPSGLPSEARVHQVSNRDTAHKGFQERIRDTVKFETYKLPPFSFGDYRTQRRRQHLQRVSDFPRSAEPLLHHP